METKKYIDSWIRKTLEDFDTVMKVKKLNGSYVILCDDKTMNDKEFKIQGWRFKKEYQKKFDKAILFVSDKNTSLTCELHDVLPDIDLSEFKIVNFKTESLKGNNAEVDRSFDFNLFQCNKPISKEVTFKRTKGLFKCAI